MCSGRRSGGTDLTSVEADSDQWGSCSRWENIMNDTIRSHWGRTFAVGTLTAALLSGGAAGGIAVAATGSQQHPAAPAATPSASASPSKTDDHSPKPSPSKTKNKRSPKPTPSKSSTHPPKPTPSKTGKHSPKP